MRRELERFVESLAIPADRKAVVLAELSDHVACASEAAVREGRDPEAAARSALGDLEALRRSLEAVERAFRVTRTSAVVRGVLAGLLVAIVIDRFGAGLVGAVGSVAALAIAALCAPTHALELLRAELRASRIRGWFGLARGVPIGPAIAYCYTVVCVPFAVWIGMIVYRAYAGVLDFDTPPSAFVVASAVCLLLLVEGLRARRRAAA